MNKSMILCVLLLLSGLTATAGEVEVHNFFPEGTRWTELRLDTKLYDSWFSEVERDGRKEYMPNFVRLDFTVGKVVRPPIDFGERRMVTCSTDSRQDSLCYYIEQSDYEVSVSLADKRVPSEESPIYALVYDFSSWEVGKDLIWETLDEAQTTKWGAWHSYGTISEIKEGKLGGDKPVQYVELEGGARLIWGIGITAWDGHECLFGPPQLYEGFYFMDLPFDREYYEGYKSILVYFEREGEVLYNLWPTETGELAEPVHDLKENRENSPFYDLQGRKLEQAPRKGMYLQGGKKWMK